MNLEQLKYPIGLPQFPKEITAKHLANWQGVIATFPIKVKTEIIDLSPEELGYRYRPEGWNIQQVVCHCIDSHINAFTRFKLALTEDNPTIKPYNEAAWAELNDTVNYPITDALSFLKLLHARWALLLNNFTPKDWENVFTHPDNKNTLPLKNQLCIYAWHCQHHLQHIINAKKFRY